MLRKAVGAPRWGVHCRACHALDPPSWEGSRQLFAHCVAATTAGDPLESPGFTGSLSFENPELVLKVIV